MGAFKAAIVNGAGFAVGSAIAGTIIALVVTRVGTGSLLSPEAEPGFLDNIKSVIGFE